MSAPLIGLFSFAGLLILIYAGMYIPIAMALTSFIAVWVMRDSFEMAATLLGLSVANSLSIYEFGVVPLFVLMGLLISIADIGKDTFEVANRFFGRLRGGLGIATVIANAIFAAITGISIASAAVFTRVAVPEMLKHRYTPRFAVGVVAGSSILGMLIPPSLLLIVYGLLTETSVGDLFIAAVLPGLLMAAMFALGIVFVAFWRPEWVRLSGTDNAENHEDELSAGAAFMKLLPVAALVVLVLGGIYGGFFTPTESGAAGALGALLIAVGKRRLTFAKLWQVLVETGHITASISLLVVGATMYSRMLALAGLPAALGGWFIDAQLGFYGLIIAYILVVLLLGTIIDSVSIMLVMLPLVLPILIGMNVDLVWFGIVTVIAVEVGLLTPPFGLCVFTIKATLNDARISLNDIFVGALPFAFAMVLVLGIVILMPWLTRALL